MLVTDVRNVMVKILIDTVNLTDSVIGLRLESQTE